MLRARWDPLYDLYAVTEDGKPSGSVSLLYHVNLSQDTGEDWTNAKLILNTPAADILNAWIPHPDDLIVESPGPPLEEELEELEGSKDLGFGDLGFEDLGFGDLGFEVFDDAAPSRRAPIPRLAQRAATISKNPMTVTYTVEALTTIPSHGISRKVLVATIPFEVVITHITTPRESPIAYLQVLEPVLLQALNEHADGSIGRCQEHKRLLSASWTNEHILRHCICLQDVHSGCRDWGYIQLHARNGHLDPSLPRAHQILR